MSQSKKDRQEFQRGLEVPPEIPYLVEDLEDLVNQSFDTFLGESPFRIKAKNFRPELLSGAQEIGIDQLGFTYLPPAPKVFTGIDLQLDYPLSKGSDNPLNLSLKWSDDTQIRLAIAGGMHLLLAEETGDDGKTFAAEQLHPEIFTEYIKNLGLPASFWSNDIKEITRDLYNCPDFSMHRSAKTQVDAASSLELVHDARLVHDLEDTKQLIQELCINIDHDRPEVRVGASEIYLPPQPTYRNMLRFERTANDSAWKFAGAYHGKLVTGEFIDELVQIDPRIGIPPSKVIDKALAVLSQVEVGS